MIQDITKSIATGVFAVAFIGFAFAACGGDGETTTTSSSGTGTGTSTSTGTGGSGGGGSSQGEKYVDAICGKFFECCNAKDLAARIGTSGIVDYAGCRILYRTYWDAGFEPLLKESEAAGRIEFDEAAFGACLDSLKAEGCTDFSTKDFGCGEFIVPKVETGGACVQDFECKSKTCESAPGSNNMKTCVDAPVQMPEGGACSGFDDCGKGLYCEMSACVQKKADGQACSSDDECQNDACVDKTNGMGTCATLCQGGGPGPGPIDEALETVGTDLIISACKRQFECCTEQELMNNFLKTEADCRLFTSAFLAIGFVEIHNDVVNGLVKIDPAKFATCVQSYVTLTCEQSAKGDEFDCSEALQGVLADGESCTDGRQCTSTYCNEPSGQPMGTCATLPGVGAPCNDECAEFFYCNAGTCAPQKAIGAACTDVDECSEGRCVADSMGTKTCTLVCDGI